MSAPVSASSPVPSLGLCSKRPLKLLPSLMPRADSASAGGSDLRDASAEAAQQLAVWSACNTDLSLLLRLPLSEFLSHLLFNRSVQRFLESFLAQISGVWEETSGVRTMDRCWKGKDEEDDEDDGEEEKSGGAKTPSQPRARVRGALPLLRSLSKRVLLVYVRVCSLELHPTVSVDGVSAVPVSSPAWLTSLFFTTSFSASPLFSSALMLDLVSFYSSVARVAHRPLLQVIMDRVADKLPYAFGQSMMHAVGVLLGALHAQIKLIHAPFVSGTASGGGAKKARFSREDMRTLVSNMSAILWTLYSMARVRPDVLRLLLQGIGPAVPVKAKAAAASSAAAVPPFLALLACLYSLTPLILQHEISQLEGKSAAALASQPDLLHLRKACLKFLDLLVRSGLLAPMGIRVDRSRAGSGSGRSFGFVLPRAVADVAKGTTAATTSSPLPTPLSVSAAADTFVSALLLLHSTTHDDSKTEGGACFLAGTPMRNLTKFNTPTAHNAFLKRANEYFEFDAILSLMLKQAQANHSGTPGAIVGEAKITRALDLLQQIDPLLLKQRCQYPPAAGSSVAKSRPQAVDLDDRKMPSSVPHMSRSASTKSNAGGADPQAIAALRDLFPTHSTDFICACLSEFNNDSEQTIKAVLEAKLPDYLQKIRDPSRFKAGDQMDASKLAGGLLSRQSSSGFSSGSGLLDDAVDDEDAFAHAASVDPDDDAAFKEFLMRTGRVHKQQAVANKGASAPTLLNNLSKADSALISSRIQAASRRFDSDEDEYNDAWDDFEQFAIDGHNPLEMDENASKDERRASSSAGQADNADEPDGAFQKRNTNNRAQPQQQQHGQGQQQGKQGQQRGVPNNRPVTAGAGTSSSSASVGSKWRESESHPDRVQIPASFRPDLAAPAGGGGDVRDQWRRDEHRKELYAACIKAQKAQQLAPSKRTAQQEADYQHGLQHGYIADKQPPSHAQPPQHAQQQAQQSVRQPQQSRQQPQSRDQGGRSHDRDDGGSSSAARGGGDGGGGFSMRGGRGGGNAGPNSARGGSSLSATAASFNPNAAAAAPTPAAASSSSSAPPGFASRPQSAAPVSASASASAAPAHWDSDASSSGDEGEGSGGQQRGGGGGGGGGGRGHSAGQSVQSMDVRAKKRKEKNKGIVGNHNRKAGAMRKQAGGGGGGGGGAF